MFKRRTICITTCVAILLGLTLVVSEVVFGGWPIPLLRTEKHVLKDDSPLTEKLAIELTKLTMQKRLKKGEQLQLRPYGYDRDNGKKKPKYFSRNSKNSNRGYVAWRKVKNGNATSYGVHIEKKGKTFICSVARWK